MTNQLRLASASAAASTNNNKGENAMTNATTANDITINNIVFNKVEGTINGSLVRNFAIAQSNGNYELINRTQLIALVAKVVKTMSAKQALATIFKTLEEVIFVSDKDYGTATVEGVVSVQQIAEVNKAYILNVGQTTLTTGGDIAKAYTAIVAANPELSIVTDKQAKKFVVVGAGAEALGFVRNGDNLISAIQLDDTSKAANRVNASNSMVARTENLVAGAVTTQTTAGDVNVVGDKFRALFVPSMAIFAQGMISLNAGFSVDFFANKTIKLEVVATSVGNDPLANVAVGDVLTRGSEILIDNVVVYTHESLTTVVVDAVAAPQLVDGIWTISIDVRMVASNRTNVKLRLNGTKGMTISSAITVAETNEWDVFHTAETVKTAQFMLEAFAQANGGVTVNKGVVYQNGVVVTQAQINAWVKSIAQTYTVSTLVHQSNVPMLVANTNGVVTFGTEVDANGCVVATQSVTGYLVDYVGGIELGSADEAASFGTVDITVQTVQSLANPRYDAAQAKRVARAAKRAITVSYVDSRNFDFMAADKVVSSVAGINAYATRINTLIAESNVKAAFQTIVNSGINTLKFAFEANNNNWVVVLPVKALVSNSSLFDTVGNAAVSASSDNVVKTIVDFLAVAATADAKGLRTELVNNRANAIVAKWASQVIASHTSTALTAGTSSFQGKVVGDFRLPLFVEYGNQQLPAVYVAANSPLFAEYATAGELVYASRTPYANVTVGVLTVAPITLDANVIAINPMLMDTNKGDFDGDLFYVAPVRLNGGAISAYEAAKFNQSTLSFGGFVRANANFTTLAAINEVTSGVKTAKTAKKLLSIYNVVTVESFVAQIERVAEVYTNHVSQCFNIAFAALQQYKARKIAGEFTNAKNETIVLQEVAAAWSRYEDDALCGYNASSYDGVVEYLKGKNSGAFTTVVIKGIATVKADAENETSTADDYATIAGAVRQAAKKYKTAAIETAVERQFALSALSATVKGNNVISIVAKAISNLSI